MWAPASDNWDADAEFIPGSDEEGGGRWYNNRPVPMDGWPLVWNDEVSFTASCTPFRHLGFFPDMDPVWRWMQAQLAGVTDPVAMNLFGYTGVASLVCAAAGAHVTHVDASKKAVAWARENAALSGLELGRINIAARGCGLASAALKDSVRYSQQRRTMGKPICEHQAIQLKLGEMATRLQAARLLTYDAARAYDKGERCDMEAGMAKYFASEAAVENSLEAMRIHGGYGYSKEYHVERYFRDAPLMCIGEGTNEMQRIIIAKQLIARNPA
jgi:hypothetical protein